MVPLTLRACHYLMLQCPTHCHRPTTVRRSIVADHLVPAGPVRDLLWSLHASARRAPNGPFTLDALIQVKDGVCRLVSPACATHSVTCQLLRPHPRCHCCNLQLEPILMRVVGSTPAELRKLAEQSTRNSALRSVACDGYFSLTLRLGGAWSSRAMAERPDLADLQLQRRQRHAANSSSSNSSSVDVTATATTDKGWAPMAAHGAAAGIGVLGVVVVQHVVPLLQARDMAMLCQTCTPMRQLLKVRTGTRPLSGRALAHVYSRWGVLLWRVRSLPCCGCQPLFLHIRRGL